MPARSVPITIGERSYHLRFDRTDIKAIENTLGIGYNHFIRPGIFGSLNATEAFLWRGLQEEDKKGDLIHFFKQDDTGKDAAGDLLWEHMGEMVTINDQILEAFFACELFKKREPTDPPAKEDDEKNPEPTGTQ